MDVCLFLAGMMLLAELARQAGVFDWLPGLALRAARQSRLRLFTLIYVTGTLVTILLSNDATAVVLTPAVLTAVRKARTDVMPCLFLCAFIANAASFVLPVSNPANLVVYGSALPPLLHWLRTFALPSLVSILATCAALYWTQRRSLQGTFPGLPEEMPLTPDGRRAAWSMVLAGCVLLVTSALGRDLGFPTFLAAIAAPGFQWRRARSIVLSVSWSVIPLVLGLFILVAALNLQGASQALAGVLAIFAGYHRATALLAASGGVGLLSNLMNNLPAGLLTSTALATAPQFREAVLIGIDLGPNLSVTGSLATLLWLVALRRAEIEVSPWTFVRTGIVVVTPALLPATLALLL